MPSLRPIAQLFLVAIVAVVSTLLVACNNSADSHDLNPDRKQKVTDGRLFGCWRAAGDGEVTNVHITPSVLYFVSQNERNILEFVVDTHNTSGDDGTLEGTVAFARVGKLESEDVGQRVRMNYRLKDETLHLEWENSLHSLNQFENNALTAVHIPRHELLLERDVEKVE